MQEFYTMLTDIGKASVANAAITNIKLNLETLVLGDGNGGYYNPNEGQESLKHEVYRQKTGTVTIDPGNPNWIVITTTLPGTVGGFYIREVGLLDEKDQLVVISKFPETYKPTADDGTIKDLTIRIRLEVVNAEAVSLKVDPTIAIATMGDILDLKLSLDKKYAPINHSHPLNFETDVNKLKMDGTARLGTSEKLVRSDHTHPSDNSKADKNHSHPISQVLERVYTN